jgi:flagellar motor switch protein FliG
MPDPVIASERVLDGPQKAAALLLMLGPQSAGRLLKRFDEPDLRIFVRAAAGLGVVGPATLDRLVDEFAADFSAGTNLLGDAGQTRTLIAETLPPNVVDDLIGSALEGDTQDVWRALARISERAIVRFLTAERPATATYILSRLDSPLAARIASALPRDRRNAALCGLIAPHPIAPGAAELVEDAVRDMLKSIAASGAAEGPARIAGSTTSSLRRRRTSCG